MHVRVNLHHFAGTILQPEAVNVQRDEGSTNQKALTRLQPPQRSFCATLKEPLTISGSYGGHILQLCQWPQGVLQEHDIRAQLRPWLGRVWYLDKSMIGRPLTAIASTVFFYLIQSSRGGLQGKAAAGTCKATEYVLRGGVNNTPNLSHLANGASLPYAFNMSPGDS